MWKILQNFLGTKQGVNKAQISQPYFHIAAYQLVTAAQQQAYVRQRMHAAAVDTAMGCDCEGEAAATALQL